MRINLLKVNAFGPFKRETVFDFNKLNKAGLFLITGPTGVGKTSIFDAICYALYGEISGFDGTLDKVRSDYAKLDDLTYVELDFSVNGTNYNIRREPTQQIVGRGNKEVMHTHQAILNYLDKQITGPSNVYKAINEIIGLNANLFRQVVMIPQGQFIKLLSASSEEKSGIFRSIFNTKGILDFQKEIFEDAKIKSGEINDIKTRINTRITELGIDETIKNMVEVEYPNYDEIFAYLSEYIEDSNKKIIALSSDLSISNEQYDKTKEKYEKVKILNENYNLLTDMKKRMEDLEGKANYFSNMEKRLSKYHIAQNLRNIIFEIEEEKKKINEKNILNREYKEKEENLKIKNEEINKSILALESQQAEVEKCKTEIFNLNQEQKNNYDKESIMIELNAYKEASIPLNNDLENLNEEYKNELMKNDELEQKQENLSTNRGNDILIVQTKEKLLEKREYLKVIDEKYKRLKEIGTSIIEDDKKFEDLREEYMATSERKAKIVKAKETNLASSLAKDLPVNAPCPVCGSTHHPKLAHFDVDIEQISIEALDKDLARINVELVSISKELTEFRKEKIEISDFLSENETVLSEKENAIELERVLEGITATNLSIEKLNRNELELNELSVAIKENKEKMKELENKIDEKKTQINENKDKILELNTKINMLNTSMSKEQIEALINSKTIFIEEYNKKILTCRSSKERITEELIDISSKLVEATTAISTIERIVSNKEQQKSDLWNSFFDEKEYNNALMTEEEHQNKQKELNEYNSQIMLVNGEIKRLNELVGNYKYEDITTLEEELLAEKSICDEKQEKLRSFKQEFNGIIEKIAGIKNEYQNCERKILAYEMIVKISRVANGNNDLKMSFENYILSVYFEDILGVANGLLATMTKNRYQLVRRDTRAGGNAKQGLDTLVYDSNTGKLRDVKTLSGGESFKTALCLALGLSEIIRRKSSIVSINTLFIDEGFGSLDPNSLDSALEILLHMKNNDCVIGIISHVSELKNRIYDKIILEPTTEGTIAKIIA